MAIPYTFHRDEDDDLWAVKTPDAGVDTKFMLLTFDPDTGGSGSSNVRVKDRHDFMVEHWDTFQYYDARDQNYYDIPFKDIQASVADGTTLAEPTPLPVRSSHWPGISAREANIAEVRLQRLRLESKVRAARDLKAYRERQIVLKAEEDRLRAEAKNALRPDAEVFAEMMEAEFGSEWRQWA